MIKRYFTGFSLILIAVGLCLLLFGGCSSKKTFIENGYDTIKTTNSMVDNLMTTLGEKYRQGEVTESEKEKITKVYNKVLQASDLVDESLADYAENETSETRQKYLTALESLSSNRAAFMKLAREVLNE